jgi:hypothetical protein
MYGRKDHGHASVNNFSSIGTLKQCIPKVGKVDVQIIRKWVASLNMHCSAFRAVKGQEYACPETRIAENNPHPCTGHRVQHPSRMRKCVVRLVAARKYELQYYSGDLDRKQYCHPTRWGHLQVLSSDGTKYKEEHTFESVKLTRIFTGERSRDKLIYIEATDSTY